MWGTLGGWPLVPLVDTPPASSWQGRNCSWEGCPGAGVSFIPACALLASPNHRACLQIPDHTTLEADLIEYSWTLLGCRPHESHDLHLLL